MAAVQSVSRETQKDMCSNNADGMELKMPPRPPRRFVPELIETVTKTNRRPRPTPIDTSSLPRSDTAPATLETPIETPTSDSSSKRRRSRDKFAEDWEEWGSKAAQEFGKRKHGEKGREKKTPRQISPQAWRSRKGSSDSIASSSSDSTPVLDTRGFSPVFLEIEAATSPLMNRRRPSWASLRSQHSFKVPELDPIESSESEPGSPFSQPLSQSTSNQSQFNSVMPQVAESESESHDERYPGYLPIASPQEPEKQLQVDEQLRNRALAAFPTESHHERVDHFIDRDDTIDVITPAETPLEERNARRESYFPESNWGVLDMKTYREKLEKQKEEKKQQKKLLEARLNKAEPKEDPWSWERTPVFNPFDMRNLLGGPLDDEEMGPMRKGARPPLLGDDLEIPRCQSPEPANFDTTQGCDAVKIAQNYLTEQTLAAERGEGLWCGSNMPSSRPSLYSLPNSNANSRSPSPRSGFKPGLWSGSCGANLLRSPPSGQIGLFTPRLGTGSPASPAPTPIKQLNVLPPTPPASDPDLSSINQKLAQEAAIEEEFGDTFVTQVYNYLSLGYPAVAHQFDEELSKISHIPVSELRQDDHLPSARGYIRLGDERSPQDNITEETCMRWRALRTYIKVWARQHPNMTPEKGTPLSMERKGSWGL